MGNISQIKLPDNNIYDLSVKGLDKTILKSYTWANYTCSSNDTNNAYLYFMKVEVGDYDCPWRVRYRLTVDTPNANCHGVYYCNIGVSRTNLSYYNENNFYSTSYRPIYNHSVLYPKSEDYSSYDQYLGVRVMSAWGVNSTSRTYTIEILEAYNCDIEFVEKKYSEIPNIGNYTNGEMNATAQGFQETGDNDTTTTVQLSSNSSKVAGNMAIMAYSLVGFDENGNYLPFSNENATRTSGSTSTHQNRLYQTSGYDYKRGIYCSTTGVAKDANTNMTIRPIHSGVDFRYSDNCVPASTANNLGLVLYKPIYWRGIIKEDGLFYISPYTVTYNNKDYTRGWTQDIPEEVQTDSDGYRYVYWYIGNQYYNSGYLNAGYQINISTYHPVLWYNNGRIEEYDKFSASTSASITSDDISTWNGKQDKLTSAGSSLVPVYINSSGVPTSVSSIKIEGTGVTEKVLRVANAANDISLTVGSNRGIWDYKSNEYMIYTKATDKTTRVSAWSNTGNANTPIYFDSTGLPVACTSLAGLGSTDYDIRTTKCNSSNSYDWVYARLKCKRGSNYVYEINAKIIPTTGTNKYTVSSLPNMITQTGYYRNFKMEAIYSNNVRNQVPLLAASLTNETAFSCSWENTSGYLNAEINVTSGTSCRLILSFDFETSTALF